MNIYCSANDLYQTIIDKKDVIQKTENEIKELQQMIININEKLTKLNKLIEQNEQKAKQLENMISKENEVLLQTTDVMISRKLTLPSIVKELSILEKQIEQLKEHQKSFTIGQTITEERMKQFKEILEEQKTDLAELLFVFCHQDILN